MTTAKDEELLVISHMLFVDASIENDVWGMLIAQAGLNYYMNFCMSKGSG
jgi:hypothetical protein